MVKKETNKSGSEKENDADFLQRIMKMKETADKKAGEGMNMFASEIAEAKTKGKEIAQNFAEIEECEKIAEEFKKDPPIFISKTISGMSVGYRCEEKYQEKVAFLKKRNFSFVHATHSTSITPLEFNSYGKAYIKRGGRKAYLPTGSKDLPFIIRDGDIIGTEKSAFVLELKDEFQDEENNYWHIFIFPNSELKIGVNERTNKREPAYMEPEKVSPAIKKNSTSTTIEYSIRDIELLSGLFNLRIKRRGKNINNLVHFAPGFPAVEFSGSGGLANELVKNEMEKAVAKLGATYLSKVAGTLAEVRSKSSQHGGDDISAFIELCKDGSVVIFSTSNRVALAGSDRMTKKISTDMYNPVKITATKGGLFETDGKQNPDYRVSEIMKLWMAVSQVAGSLTTQEEPQLGMGGKRLDTDDAKEMLEYAKALGEEDIEKAAEEILKDQERRPKSTEKQPRDIEAEKESQKREAAEMLKFAEESGEEELIAVAKAQVAVAADGGQSMYSGADIAEMENSARRAKDYFEQNIAKSKAQMEDSLPDYNSPISSDAV
jgi:hypothetical protein